MIKSFSHKGLKHFFLTGSTAGINPAHAPLLRTRLGVLNEARNLKELNLPGYRLHKLKGDKRDFWSVAVNANWRMTFAFSEGDVWVLNYGDYH